MSYIGETPVKKYARLRYWQEVKKRCGHGFLTRKHVFLASEHAGDASVLSAMGVPWENMIAVDLDAKACLKASKRWPLLRVEHDAIDKFAAKWTGMHPCSVYLDFCSQLSERTKQVWANIIRDWWGAAAIGVTLLKGRESKKVWAEIGRMSKTSAYQKDVSRLHAQATARTHLLYSMTLANVIAGGRATGKPAFEVKCHIGYRTVSPMLIGLFLPVPLSSVKSRGSIDPKSPCYQLAWADYSNLIPSIEIANRTWADVRSSVLSQQFGSNTAGLLNVDPRQAAAWKAHSTRGTYKAAA